MVIACKRLVLNVVGLAALGVSLPTSADNFGVNLNESFDRYDAGLVNGVNANWVRGFVELRRFVNRYVQLKASSPTPVAALAAEMRNDAKIRALLDINGKSMIVNLKYDYSDLAFPTGAAYDDVERVTQAFLDVIWDKANIIVMGNEPFIESINSDAQRGSALTVFYRAVTNFAIQHRTTKPVSKPLYVGAFNNLHQPGNFRTYSDALLAYAKNTAGVAGVDIHAHVPDVAGAASAFDYARARVGSKPMIVTEYSLIHNWRVHIDSPVQSNAGFSLTPTEAANHNTARKFIDYAMGRKIAGNPITLERWNAFLQAQPWYSARQTFLTNFRTEMQSRNVQKAMYGLLNTQTSLPPSADPWVLNPLYCTSVCPNGSSMQQWPWYAVFKNNLPH